MRLFHAEDLHDLAVGAAILGAGGGGDPYIGRLVAQNALREFGPVPVIDVDEVPDDALVAMSAMMGAPTVMMEKLPAGDELIRAFEALQERLGGPITHTVCAEVGGLNSTMPFVTAATLGLPLVDADGMGRAFPEVQMCTPTIYGISATPMALADEKGNTAVIDAIDNTWTERIARTICIDMGASALVALYSQSGKELKMTMIPGTLTLAQELGMLVRSSRFHHGDPIGAALERLGGFLLFRGRVVDVDRRTEAGFARGSAVLEGSGIDADHTLRIDFQNENLVAERDDQVLATVPDVVTVLEADTGGPITTEELRYGFRVVVIGVPCDPRWRTEPGLELVGPEYFGYEIPYIPVEERYATSERR